MDRIEGTAMSEFAIIVGVGSLAAAGLLIYQRRDPVAAGYFILCGIGCIVGGLLV